MIPRSETKTTEIIIQPNCRYEIEIPPLTEFLTINFTITNPLNTKIYNIFMYYSQYTNWTQDLYAMPPGSYILMNYSARESYHFILSDDKRYIFVLYNNNSYEVTVELSMEYFSILAIVIIYIIAAWVIGITVGIAVYIKKRRQRKVLRERQNF